MSGGITTEQNAVLTVANGLAYEAKLRAVKPVTEETDGEQYQRAGDEQAAHRSWPGIFFHERMAQDKFEISEAIVSTHREIVAEKHECRPVSQRLSENG